MAKRLFNQQTCQFKGSKTVGYNPIPPPPPRRTVAPSGDNWPMSFPRIGDTHDEVANDIIAHLNNLHERVQTIEDTIGLALEETDDDT